MTHEHEVSREGNVRGRGCGLEGGKGERKNGTMVIA